MTSIINNSNANSALVNTLNASDSKMNPNIYTTKKIFPPAATCYVRTDLASGTIKEGNSVVFNLLKYGIAQQILLCYTKVGASNMELDEGDFFNIIDRVELLSSSKVIAQLTKYDLLAQFSNLDASQYHNVGEYVIKARGAGASQKFVIPLVFGFMKDVNTNLNLQFNEPMSIRVKFGSQFEKSKSGSGAPTANNAIQDVYLRMRYKAYNESDFAEIVAENYNQPELNTMSTGFYDESAGTLTIDTESGTPVAKTRTINAQLKNTDCVNDFYVFVRQVDNDGTKTAQTSSPEKLTNLKFTASGQEIINLTGEELSFTRLAMNGYAVEPLLDSAGSNWVTNVYKIQTGLWEYSGGGTQSNTLSLRELNNPIIEAEFSKAADTSNKKNYELVVVEDCVKIFSTTSSNGRVQIALSN